VQAVVVVAQVSQVAQPETVVLLVGLEMVVAVAEVH
jgi:hypothetical protein